MSRQLLYSLPWKNELEDGRLASAIIFQLLKIFRILKQNIPVILAVVGPFLSVRKLPYLAVKRMFSLNDIQGSKVGHGFFSCTNQWQYRREGLVGRTAGLLPEGFTDILSLITWKGEILSFLTLPRTLAGINGNFINCSSGQNASQVRIKIGMGYAIVKGSMVFSFPLANSKIFGKSCLDIRYYIFNRALLKVDFFLLLLL